MKKIVSILLVIALLISGLFILTGCDNEKTASMNNKGYAEMTAEELLSANVKDKNNVTVDEYIALISTLSNVTIKDDLTLEKNITEEAMKLIDSKAKPKLDEYLEALLTSDIPQVRGYGISTVTSLTGVSDKNLDLAKKLINTETNEYVLNQATKALSNEAKDKEVATFLIKMSNNENATIRKNAASALANSWSKGVDGVTDAVIKLMNDKDTDVRKAACSGSGKLADEAVIEPLVKILNNAEDADIHASCIEGLAHLWYDYPFFENTSEKAYKATMDYYKKTPRTEKVPAWNGLSAFRTTSTQDSFKAWKQKATYFNTEELYNIMVDIIKDGNANYLTRTGAIDIIKAHCSEEQFNSLKAVVDGLTDGKASSVQSAYSSK